MCSKENVFRSVKNNADINVANLKNDQTTIVGNEVQLKIQPEKVGFLARPAYIFKSGFALQRGYCIQCVLYSPGHEV